MYKEDELFVFKFILNRLKKEIDQMLSDKPLGFRKAVVVQIQ